jgi:acetylornithine deacetylase
VAIRKGLGDGPALILYSHIDTVPVDPNTHWTHDPFGGDIADGRIYGRGAADMKGGAGVALVALEILDELDIRFQGDVAAHFLLDEEAGGNGTLAAIQRGHYGPHAGCIMLEPTSPNVMLISGRGAQFFRITVPGQEGGTEYHRDLVSAIDAAYVVYSAVKHYARMREAAVSDPLYEGHERTKVPTAICTMQAGAWPSTVPGEAVMEGTIECLPGEDIHQVVDAFERYLREIAADDPWLREHPFTFERFGLWFEAAGITPDAPFVQALQCAARTALGFEPRVLGGGGSDLRLPILHAGCPTVLWGPGGGPIHSVDEWVSIDQLVAMLKASLVAAVEWCGVPSVRPTG